MQGKHQASAGTKPAPVHVLAAGKRFGKYKDEAEKKVREAQVEHGPVQELVGLLRQYLENGKVEGKALDIVSGAATYSAQDIEGFSLALGDLEHLEGFSTKAGHFLSSLIENGGDLEYVIHTAHLDTRIDNLCTENTKEVTIIGDVGAQLGAGMRKGSVTVKGSAGQSAGKRMAGGLMVIDGNVGEYLGIEMKNGTILVKGDAGDSVGSHMQAGRITINGNTHGTIGDAMEDGIIIIKGDALDADTMPKGGEIHIEGELKICEDRKGLKISSSGGKVFHRGRLMAEDEASLFAYADMYDLDELDGPDMEDLTPYHDVISEDEED